MSLCNTISAREVFPIPLLPTSVITGWRSFANVRGRILYKKSTTQLEAVTRSVSSSARLPSCEIRLATTLSGTICSRTLKNTTICFGRWQTPFHTLLQRRHNALSAASVMQMRDHPVLVRNQNAPTDCTPLRPLRKSGRFQQARPGVLLR